MSRGARTLVQIRLIHACGAYAHVPAHTGAPADNTSNEVRYFMVHHNMLRNTNQAASSLVP